MATELAYLDETPWLLEVNGRPWAGGTFTRGHAEALGAGRLVASGTVVRRSDLIDIHATSLQPDTTVIRATVDSERVWLAEQERRHMLERGCGLLHVIACDTSAVRRHRVLDLPPADSFPALFRTLFDGASRRHPEGGVHSAALTDGQHLIGQLEDVSRHGVVEKTIGAAFLDGIDLSKLGLILSARISAQIALSASRAGLAWIASRSVATTLAIRIAATARLPVVERAPGPRSRLAAGPAWDEH